MSAVAKGLSSVSGVLVILINHIESVSGLIINVCPDLTVYAFHKQITVFFGRIWDTFSVFNICNSRSKNIFIIMSSYLK